MEAHAHTNNTIAVDTIINITLSQSRIVVILRSTPTYNYNGFLEASGIVIIHTEPVRGLDTKIETIVFVPADKVMAN